MNIGSNDPTLNEIIIFLTKKHKCHTVLLYGSRAKGTESKISDYDVVGIVKRGQHQRIAKKKNGEYWDLAIYPEKDLKKLSDYHLDWLDSKILFSKNDYAKYLLKRIKTIAQKPPAKTPKNEIVHLRIWAQKQIDRIAAKNTLSDFRTIELIFASIEHYFLIRNLRYRGPKSSLTWLKSKDKKVHNLFIGLCEKPHNQRDINSLVKTVYQLKDQP